MDYNADDFIAYHNSKYICYCEVIIFPDGRVTYANPSHLIKLETIWGVPLEEVYEGGPTRDKLWDSIPSSASPLHWLSEELNCVVLWYNAIIFPLNYTEAQLDCVKRLMKAGCIDSDLIVQVTVERTICDPSNRTCEQIEKIRNNQCSVMKKLQSSLSKIIL